MITITIGEVSVTYQLVETTAPPAYDGFGSFTLYETGAGAKHPKRMVLVQEEHLAWQLGRYHSGMHEGKVHEDDRSMRRYLTTRLWEKITGQA
jgi:hypothetical protein